MYKYKIIGSSGSLEDHVYITRSQVDNPRNLIGQDILITFDEDDIHIKVTVENIKCQVAASSQKGKMIGLRVKFNTILTEEILKSYVNWIYNYIVINLDGITYSFFHGIIKSTDDNLTDN